MKTSGSLCLVPRQHACCSKNLSARPTCVSMLVLGDLEDHSVGFQEQIEDIVHTECWLMSDAEDTEMSVVPGCGH